MEGGLDPSWKIGTIWSFLDHKQFGVDIVFPHGPLDFLEVPVMVDHNLWVLSVLFNLLKYVTFVICLYMLFRQLSVKWYVYITIIPALAYLSIMTDSLALITFSTYSFIVFLKDEKLDATGMALTFIIAFILAASSLIKFNILVATVVMIPLMAGVFLACHRKIRYLAYFSAGYFAMLISLWMLAGQSIFNAWAFIKTGVELSLGYNSAMLVAMTGGDAFAMFFTIAAIFALLAFSVICRKNQLFVFIIFNAVILAADYKHGIVRQAYVFQTTSLLLFSMFLIVILNKSEPDQASLLGPAGLLLVAFCQLLRITVDPLVMVLAFAAIFTCIFYIMVNTRKIKRIDKLAYYAVVLCFITAVLQVVSISGGGHNVSFDVPSNLASFGKTIGYMADTGQFNTALNAQISQIKKGYILDNSTRARIGNATVDIFPWDIALCKAYDMNWTPRPVFQSYSVYTDELDDLNSRFYSDEPPQYLLYSYGSIDDRYPLFDEPATFRNILFNYSYARTSGPFILLNRSIDRPRGAAVDLGTVNVKMGQDVTVPRYNGYVFCYVDSGYSGYGEIKSLIYKPSPLYIRFKLNDGHYTKNYRFISSQAKNGILVSAYAQNAYDLLNIFKGQRINNADKIVIDTEDRLDYSDLNLTFIGIPYTRI